MAPRNLLENLPSNQPKDLLAEIKAQNIKAQPVNSGPSIIDYAVDAARSIPGGLAKGVTGIVGMAGDYLNPSTTETIEGLGGEPIVVNKGAARRGFPTTEQLNAFVAAPTGGYYKPKYAAGEYAQTIAEFAPNMFGGEANLIRKGLNTLGSAIGSETAGRIAKDTELETPMRIAGALMGHGIASKGQKIAETGSISNLKEAEKATASVQEKKDAADTFYNTARNAGFSIKNNSFNNFKKTILSTAKKEGIRTELTPKAIGTVKLIDETTGNVSLSDLHDIRKIISKNVSTADKTDRNAVRLILDKVDDYIEGLSSQDVKSGDPTTATAFLKEAKKLWRQASQGDVIEKTIEKAKDKSGPLLNDFDKQVRVAFQKLRDNKRGFERLDPDVQSAVKRAAEGSGLGHNFAYTVGKLIPTTTLSGGATLGSEVALAFAAPKALAALPLALGSKMYSSAKTGQAARLASVLARGGKIESDIPMSKKQKILSALLAAQGTEEPTRPNYEEIKE